MFIYRKHNEVIKLYSLASQRLCLHERLQCAGLSTEQERKNTTKREDNARPAGFSSPGSYRRWKVQQAAWGGAGAGAGGVEGAGAVDLDEGGRRSGAAPWLGPAPVEQTDPGVAQQPPPQRWRGRPPG